MNKTKTPCGRAGGGSHQGQHDHEPKYPHHNRVPAATASDSNQPPGKDMAMKGDYTVEIGADLRRLFWRARHDKGLFPPRGLTQDQVAARIGRSQVWYRQIENGYVSAASLDTITAICETLGITTTVLDALGYNQVADELRAAQDNVVEVDLSKAAALTAEEQAALRILLGKIQRTEEPLGRDIWRK